MKKIACILVVLSFFTNCKKNEILPITTITEEEKAEIMETMRLSSASFMNGAHPTSGTVEILENKNDKTKKYLSFTDFKTDSGPDLRIYLAEDTKTTGFIEVGKLSKTGTFLIEIPEKAMLDKQKYVLIWCEDFSVLFGSAKLE